MEQVKYSKKLLVSLLTGLMGAATIHRVLARHAQGLLPAAAIIGIALLFLVGCLVCSRRTRLSVFHGLLLYLLAFDFSLFGWQKIFHLQMVVPLGELDRPFNSLDSETLTWAYFRRSYPFTVAIALSQMASAWMLLFVRTRLLGLVIMVPVLLNIMLIDTFYHLHPAVLVHAILLFICVIYLLLQSYDQLVQFFFKTVHVVAGQSKVAMLVVVLLPLLLLASYRFPDRHPQFSGKYRVHDLIINDMPTAARSVKDSVLTTLYMDLQDDLVLVFNHHDSRYIGTYYFDEKTDSLSVKWRYPAGFNAPFAGKFVAGEQPGSYTFSGVLKGDRIAMQLERVPEP
ncbi:hypothetical protein MKQ70_02805 [Chitinophaga sedimenti]|uniref:hypothetical protein n=1 Tax=Chitinophaga sedimenti TaxID=2033606 RepID=UPI002002B259|nr:hypothetical protein [Chitinophaga sedimenti]MCK7553994.1 hypothetical protein [Chitinophaga sedimenti]